MDSKTTAIPPVIILSTGRCGSTMVSEMLNIHPGILSLSEFFVPLGLDAFALRKPDGKQMWHLYSHQNAALKSMVKDGVTVSENLYPFAQPDSRFQPNNCPPILFVTLPHLTPDYERLYDDLEALVLAQPKMPLADHYRFLFETLMDKLDRKVWVERSGGSLMHAAKLIKLFPDARMIHVYRDGRDTAMSMSRHRNFQVLIAGIKKCGTLYNTRREFLKTQNSRLDVWMQRIVFSALSVERLLKVPVTLEDYAAFWNDLIHVGQEVLSTLPEDRLLNVKFEDMQQAPREELRKLIHFIDPSLEDESWLNQAATIPKRTSSSFLKLPEAEQASLTRACESGLRLLGYPT